MPRNELAAKYGTRPEMQNPYQQGGRHEQVGQFRRPEHQPHEKLAPREESFAMDREGNLSPEARRQAEAYIKLLQENMPASQQRVDDKFRSVSRQQEGDPRRLDARSHSIDSTRDRIDRDRARPNSREIAGPAPNRQPVRRSLGDGLGNADPVSAKPLPPVADRARPREDAARSRDNKYPGRTGSHIDDAVAAIERELADKGLSPKEKLQKELHKRFLLMAAGNYKEAVRDIDQLEPEHQVFLKKQLYSLQVYANPETSPKDSHRAAAAVDFAREAVESLASVSKLELRNLSFCKQVHGFSRYDPVKVPVFTPTQDVVIYVEVDNFVSEETKEGEYEMGLKASYAIMHNDKKVSSMDLPVSPQRTRSRRRDYYVAYRVYMPDDAADGEYQFVLVMEDTKGKKFGTGKLDFKIQNPNKK